MFQYKQALILWLEQCGSVGYWQPSVVCPVLPKREGRRCWPPSLLIGIVTIGLWVYISSYFQKSSWFRLIQVETFLDFKESHFSTQKFRHQLLEPDLREGNNHLMGPIINIDRGTTPLSKGLIWLGTNLLEPMTNTEWGTNPLSGTNHQPWKRAQPFRLTNHQPLD